LNPPLKNAKWDGKNEFIANASRSCVLLATFESLLKLFVGEQDVSKKRREKTWMTGVNMRNVFFEVIG